MGSRKKVNPLQRIRRQSGDESAVCRKEFFERKRKEETGKVKYSLICFLNFKYLTSTRILEKMKKMVIDTLY
jgi:hypothetical protein